MDNTDEALRALEIAKNKLALGDISGAERFAKKSLTIHKTAAAETFLANLASSSSSEAHASTARQRHHVPAPKQQEASTSKPKKDDVKRDFTPEQAAIVKRIRTCQRTAYYEILTVEKTCSDADIKKAYRKHSLSVHPDKNGAPGADEAFKMVSTAFQVLSDADKRAHFDRFGNDPDDRRAGFSSAAPQFARRQHSAFGGDELSPEDLFNMFFGGGMGNGGFQAFGGPGVRTYSFGGGPPMRRRAGHAQPNQQQQGNTPAWMQLLPLLLIFAFSLLTQLPSLFSSAPPPDPSFSFEPTAVHTLHRQTSNIKADYFLNPNELRHSHLYTDLLSSNPFQTDGLWAKLETSPLFKDVSVPRTMTEFESRVENSLVHHLRVRCENENDIQWRKIQRAQGLMGFIGRDDAEIERLQRAVLPSCDRLRKFGLSTRRAYHY